MPTPVVFRPRGGVILAVIAIAVCAVGLISLSVTDGLPGVLQWGAPIVAFAWLAWLLYIWPCVQMTDGFVEIRNVLRTFRVPWGDIADVDSRFALTISTHDARRIRAWAAPAPSARRALGTRREEVKNTPGEGELRRPSDATGTESGDALALVQRALEKHRREGGPALPGGTAVHWHVWSLAVTVLLLIAAVVSLVQTAAHG